MRFSGTDAMLLYLDGPRHYQRTATRGLHGRQPLSSLGARVRGIVDEMRRDFSARDTCFDPRHAPAPAVN